MKTLIAYYSYTQSNEELAVRLRKKIGGDLLKIEEIKKRTPLAIFLDLLFGRKPAIKTEPCSVKDYDHVVLIAPIWGAKVATPLVTFLTAEKKNIQRYSFLTFCGGVEGQREKIVKQLSRLVEKDPAFVSELWLKDLPMTKEKRNSLKWNAGYRMVDTDFQFFEPEIDMFLNMSGVSQGKDLSVLHEHGH